MRKSISIDCILTAIRRPKAEGLKITIYERQDGPGGVWDFTANPDDPLSSPMYGSFEAKLTCELMALCAFPYAGGLLFPERDDVEQCLGDHSEGLEVDAFWPPNDELVGPVKTLHRKQRRVQLGATGAAEVGHIIFCTGFQYTTPFLCEGKLVGTHLFPDGSHVEDLDEHMFYTKRASLISLGVPRTTPAFIVSTSANSRNGVWRQMSQMQMCLLEMNPSGGMTE
ncbi:uncharacterized protein BCR38DRAFT_491258 [Pseudomassariella vexata]|uniref:Uncharacterized protein n=1 Tax=Pseudomassariella vexata TaxID=1141098 RepID=A0A1Y2D7C4_9PEZI|nr:uncharacterized protein BCR38DRAFT_491258 [Pseudomassariella vexata]ORY55107.1 hypothetical protein BCR38DRAFT_491258 [Pseudomassariella vexata]